jgi:hypothetical protein
MRQEVNIDLLYSLPNMTTMLYEQKVQYAK